MNQSPADPAPIQHLVILAHPASRSFNRLLAETYCETVASCGQKAVLRDLYAMRFDPLLKPGERPDRTGSEPAPDVQPELELVRASAVITLVYPIWFGMPPAMIKGYVDRVLGAGLTPGRIAAAAQDPPRDDRHLLIISSSATSLIWLDEHGQWESLRRAFDIYLSTILSLTLHSHLHFDRIVEDIPERFIAQHCEDVRIAARKCCEQLLAPASRGG